MGKRNDGGSGWTRRFVARVDWLRIRRATVFIIVCWLFSNSDPKALPLNVETVEYPVKLAFLYNFTKFVEWPSDSFRNPDAPLVICIVGNDPFSPLTVGETEGFAVRGGIINLTAEGNKLHFEVNLLAAERAGLKISAKMLALAKIVNDENHSAEE